MDWNAFGVVAACAWCGLLLALGVWKILNAESQSAQRLSRSGGRAPSLKPSLRSLRLSALASLGLTASPRVAATRKGRLRASALKQKPLPALVFLAFAALATVEAQKTGQLRVGMERGEAATATLNSQLSTLNSTRAANHEINPAPLTDADIDRGYILVDEDDSAAAIEIPTNAVTVGNWHLHGASSNFGNHRLDLSPWSFPMGTNGASFSSFWYFVEGKVRPTPRDAAHEICAVGAPMLAMQGASCLWLSEGADDSRTIIWGSFFLNGDTNAPVTAQVTLWPDGAFATQSNNLRRVYARIDPRDWDGDGLANEIDPAPKSHDGDCFGTGVAWLNANCGNVLSAATNTLGEIEIAWNDGVCTNAYYWLTFTSLADNNFISVTCDGDSDLGNLAIVANSSQVCRVPLLMGAEYVVHADAPLADIAASDENAEIVYYDSPAALMNGAPQLRAGRPRLLAQGGGPSASFSVRVPLEFSFEPDGNGGYALSTSPRDVGAVLTNLVGGCCSPVLSANGFRWTCADTCTCHGHEHALDVAVSWGGYSCSLLWCDFCSCHYTGGGWGSTNGVAALSMTLPKVLFTNNDGGAEPGDIAALSLGFVSPTPTNGTLTLDLALPSLDVNVWAYSNRVGAVAFPLTWNVEDFTGLELFVEGRAEDVMEEINCFTFEWRDDGGTLLAGVTNRFTVYHPVANVVNGTLRDGGELCNPAAVVTGTNACFALEFPTLHPALNPIRWSVAEGDARFVGGDTGERVRVASDVANQVVTLRAQIGDAVSRPIEMKAHVVEPVRVKTTVWIVRDDFGGNAARSAADVTNVIAEVNRVYAQIGVSFYIDSISYTNDSDLLDLTDGTLSNGRDHLMVSELVNLSQNTDGVELYFVNDVGGGALGCSNDYGSIVSASGDALTVAHELGHSFRTSANSPCLKDVYPHGKRNASLALLHNEISRAHLYDDWNNGTGLRYYENGKSQSDVIKRLLMCGIRYPNIGDLSAGQVYGLREDNAETTVDVGFFTGNIRKLPSHR